ncbi:MAG: hypothetical protein HS115_15055 [Spirochaetales bacterium]|nr:hypothetical protein [Spirochaetales bacterium]
MTTLYYQLCKEGKDFTACVWTQEMEESFTPNSPGSSITEGFHTIYQALEEKSEDLWRNARSAIVALSEALIEPVAKHFRAADQVAFIVENESVRFALDLLRLDGTPLYQKFPVVYLLDESESNADPALEMDYAFCMADLSCDPEKGLKQAAGLFKESDYVEMEETNLGEVLDGGSDTTALIISAHGEVDAENSGSLSINKEEFDSDSIQSLDCDIIYLDSCQMGVAFDVIEACSQEEASSYYLAPITSNDAGDSSTLTVTWFFSALKESGHPLQALFETRNSLTAHYEKKGLSEVVVLNKAFPFRIYEFPGS